MTIELKFSLSDAAAELIPRLQVELGCESRSEMIELLILSQFHPPFTARALLANREKRGRRWNIKPIELPDEYGVG